MRRVQGLRPFWRYYGSKWRIAPRYPRPRYDTIIEPFAGAAGYSLRYPERQVILVEKYPKIAAIWRYLISVSSLELMMIPEVDDVDDLPAWVPQEARWLVGFSMNASASTPRKTLSAGRRMLRYYNASQCEGWTATMRARCAEQVTRIRHWQVIEGDYSSAPNVTATWFIDAPYRGRAGSHYVHSSAKIVYQDLSTWCIGRSGQTIVCESGGATWLPFRTFATTNGFGGMPQHEAIWTSHPETQP